MLFETDLLLCCWLTFARSFPLFPEKCRRWYNHSLWLMEQIIPRPDAMKKLTKSKGVEKRATSGKF